jgi:hypothetical protein
MLKTHHKYQYYMVALDIFYLDLEMIEIDSK